jgi:hypothetical protein
MEAPQMKLNIQQMSWSSTGLWYHHARVIISLPSSTQQVFHQLSYYNEIATYDVTKYTPIDPTTPE